MAAATVGVDGGGTGSGGSSGTRVGVVGGRDVVGGRWRGRGRRPAVAEGQREEACGGRDPVTKGLRCRLKTEKAVCGWGIGPVGKVVMGRSVALLFLDRDLRNISSGPI